MVKFLGIPRLPSYPTPPVPGLPGMMYFDSSVNKAFVFDGTTWIEVSEGSLGVIGGPDLFFELGTTSANDGQFRATKNRQEQATTNLNDGQFKATKNRQEQGSTDTSTEVENLTTTVFTSDTTLLARQTPWNGTTYADSSFTRVRRDSVHWSLDPLSSDFDFSGRVVSSYALLQTAAQVTEVTFTCESSHAAHDPIFGFVRSNTDFGPLSNTDSFEGATPDSSTDNVYWWDGRIYRGSLDLTGAGTTVDFSVRQAVRMRFDASTSTFQVRVWPAGTDEPGTWGYTLAGIANVTYPADGWRLLWSYETDTNSGSEETIKFDDLAITEGTRGAVPLFDEQAKFTLNEQVQGTTSMDGSKRTRQPLLAAVWMDPAAMTFAGGSTTNNAVDERPSTVALTTATGSNSDQFLYWNLGTITIPSPQGFSVIPELSEVVTFGRINNINPLGAEYGEIGIYSGASPSFFDDVTGKPARDFTHFSGAGHNHILAPGYVADSQEAHVALDARTSFSTLGNVNTKLLHGKDAIGANNTGTVRAQGQPAIIAFLRENSAGSTYVAARARPGSTGVASTQVSNSVSDRRWAPTSGVTEGRIVGAMGLLDHNATASFRSINPLNPYTMWTRITGADPAVGTANARVYFGISSPSGAAGTNLADDGGSFAAFGLQLDLGSTRSARLFQRTSGGTVSYPSTFYSSSGLPPSAQTASTDGRCGLWMQVRLVAPVTAANPVPRYEIGFAGAPFNVAFDPQAFDFSNNAFVFDWTTFDYATHVNGSSPNMSFGANLRTTSSGANFSVPNFVFYQDTSP